MKLQEVPVVKNPISPYKLALETAEKMGEFDIKKDDYIEWTNKAEELIGEDVVGFFDTKVRTWCTQSASQEHIDSILAKLYRLQRMNTEEDSNSNIRLEITHKIHLLWLTEKRLREEVQKRGMGQMFLLGGVIVGLSALTLGKVGMENAQNVQFPMYELQVEDLPESLQGVSIVHLSDLHAKDGFIGNPINPESLLEMNEELRTLFAENHLDLEKVIVTITGDCFTEGASDEEISNISEELGNFPGKKFFVLGNHDVYHEKTKFIVSELEKNKVTHVDFSGVKEGEIEIMGLPDATTQVGLYTPEVFSQIKKEPEGALRILLNHDLSSVDSLLIAMKNTLVLSGHTHGGQIDILPEQWRDWLHEMIGFDYRARIFSGMEQINRNTVAGVSNGAGVHTLPVRFNAQAEVPIIVLEALQEPVVEESKNSVRKNIKEVFTFRNN